MEIERRKLLANRRMLRLREAQFQEQRRHYKAMERAFNTHIQQQRVMMEQMTDSHAALRQAVDILGQATLLLQGRQRVEDASAPHPSNNSRVCRPVKRLRGRPRRSSPIQP